MVDRPAKYKERGIDFDKGQRTNGARAFGAPCTVALHRCPVRWPLSMTGKQRSLTTLHGLLRMPFTRNLCIYTNSIRLPFE